MADAVPKKIDLSDEGRPAEEAPETRVRRMSLLWIVATLIFACMAATFLEFKSRSAHMAMSNLPLAVLLLFIFWLLGNTLLKRLFPQFSLTTAELRAMLCVLWVGASFAGYNWVTQWVGALVSPRYFASPENRVREVVPFLPDWLFPEDSPEVIVQLFEGLKPGASIPWGAWFRGGQA